MNNRQKIVISILITKFTIRILTVQPFLLLYKCINLNANATLIKNLKACNYCLILNIKPLSNLYV